MTIYKPPENYPFAKTQEFPLVFLAGSIEMGAAEDWQTKIGNRLSGQGIGVLNPRRDDWDSSWEQSIMNWQFREQVEWELKGLEVCDLAFVNIDPSTKSPITLMEIGLLAKMKPENTIISCPKGFWRRGNVEIIACRYGMLLFTNIEAAFGALMIRLEI